MNQQDALMNRREVALLKADSLTAQCKSCTKRLPFSVDRAGLECCQDCPIQLQIYPVRRELEETLSQLRSIRNKR
ncbi:hypothetical protein D3C74_51040 [compost metagenome]